MGSPAFRTSFASAERQPDILRPGFDVLDDVVRLSDARGLVLARVSTNEDALALGRHVERRSASAGRRVLRAGLGVESAWRDIASRLGLHALPNDPEDAASALAEAAHRVRGVLIATLDRASSWEQSVASALVEHAGSALVVVITTGGIDLALPGVTTFEVQAHLDESGLARWWEATAAEQTARMDANLSELEDWLESARSAPPQSRAAEQLTAPESTLLARLSLAGRAWPEARIADLADASALASLQARGFVEVRDGLVCARVAETSADASDAGAVARALGPAFADDAFALTRSAELWAEAGDVASAEATMSRAFGLAAGGAGRVELWLRWRRTVDALPEPLARGVRLRGAELALELGDVDVALEWAQRASSAEPRARAAFVLGRAALARGDLVSASAALTRAREIADSNEIRHAACVQIAEVRYAGGDLEGASELASEVLADAPAASVRLEARNLAGKLLLARGEWVAADAHFAADECDALCSGDSTAELRARVNRAIALLSRGSSDEAGAMLQKVLDDAESRGEDRAIGFALSNLAVLAIERHDYARGLDLLERTIAAHKRLGDRLNFVRDIINLVELRLRLGLWDQAEQALRFGRHALGPGAPGSRLAELALASAHVELCRGRTLDAERDVRAALRAAVQSTDGDKLGECHRLAARIALEDGVVARAEVEISRARELARSPYDRAEVALLEAMASRAGGRPSMDLARTAVIAARESGDEELARESHVLAAEIALTEGEDAHAASHVSAAAVLRDEVARALPPALREAYLTRPALLRLGRIERVTEGAAVEPASRELPSVPPPRVASLPPRYVGRHPSVRSLLDSVGRVGRTGATVLIHGESGTGKELVAELIHGASTRAGGPLVKVNCAALVESLLLSELFGHEKGAFTGASARRRGRFERANGGTLFLDEIGDISPRTQVALLRVLEERRIERVGGAAPIDVDVRIVCATNRDLRAMVERGEFREDLYYRLSGITLEVPALRERTSDLPLLCEAILERIARERSEKPKQITPEAIELCGRHRWPGNVRELENALRAASLLSDGPSVDVGDLVDHVESLRKVSAESPARRTDSVPAMRLVSASDAEPEPEAREDVPLVAYREIRGGGVSLSDLKRNIERECIFRALTEAGGNITRAATLLGMKRPRLSQLVKQYGFVTNGTEDPS